MWIPVSLFPQTLLSPTNGLMNKVSMVARMQVMQRLSPMDCHSSRLAWSWPPLSTQSASNREQRQTPKMAPIPGAISQLRAGTLSTLVTTFIVEKAVIRSYWNRETGFPSCTQCFYQSYHLRTYRMPYPPSWYSAQHCSDQRTHFAGKEVRQWARTHRILWPYCVPHHPEAAGLIERWNGLP